MEAHPFLAELQRLERAYARASHRNTLNAAEIAGLAAHGLQISWLWPYEGPDGLWFFVASVTVDGEEHGVHRIADCHMFWAREFLRGENAVFAIADRFAPICPVMKYDLALQEPCGTCGRLSPLVVNFRDRRTDGIRKVERELYALCTACPVLTVFGRGEYFPDAH